MITLYQGDYINAYTSTFSGFYTLIGSLSGTNNVSGILAQGILYYAGGSYPSTPLFQVPAGDTAQIWNLFIYANASINVYVELGTTTPALGGSPTSAQIALLTLSANQFAALDSRGVWTVYNTAGVPESHAV